MLNKRFADGKSLDERFAQQSTFDWSFAVLFTKIYSAHNIIRFSGYLVIEFRLIVHRHVQRYCRKVLTNAWLSKYRSNAPNVSLCIMPKAVLRATHATHVQL